MGNDWIVPDWPAPLTVRAVTTTRHGGVSGGTWQSMNPADHVGDDPSAVAANRTRLADMLDLPGPPVWLQQVRRRWPVRRLRYTPWTITRFVWR